MKVSVITGAASGIGLALSEASLEQGITVVMVDKAADSLEKAAQRLGAVYPEYQVHPVLCDITQPERLTQLVEYITTHLGQVDYLYNNAGIVGPLGPVWELNPQHLHQVMEVNVYAMLHLIRALMPVLLNQSISCHIINMASLYAVCSGSQVAPYAISKHAVLALSEALYFDVQRLSQSIDVSVVLPSFTDTALFSHTDLDSPFQNSLNELLSHSRPAKDVAIHILQEVDQKRFYIFPDREVKGYAQERTEAMILQKSPHKHQVEKIVDALLKRSKHR